MPEHTKYPFFPAVSTGRLSGQVALGSTAANALIQSNSELGRGLGDRGRGCDKGAIRVAIRTSGRQKEPSVTPDFNKLRVSGLLARQRCSLAGEFNVVHCIDENMLTCNKHPTQRGYSSGLRASAK